MRDRTYVVAISAFLLSASLFVVATFPASLAWQLIQPHLPMPPEVRVVTMTGKVWDGNAMVEIQSREMVEPVPLIVSWRLALRRLLLGELKLFTDIEAEAGHVRGALGRTLSAWSLALEYGHLDVAKLASRLTGLTVSVEGQLDLKQILLIWDHDRFTEASGHMVLRDGWVSYPAGSGFHQSALPELNGAVEVVPDGVGLNVWAEKPSEALFYLKLTNDGWGSLETRKRLMDVLNEPWQQQVSPDAIIFSARRRLLQLIPSK